MSILITGAAGFIGSNLVKTFLDQNKIVVGVDNLSRGEFSNLDFAKDSENFHFGILNILDYQEFKNFVKKKAFILWVRCFAITKQSPATKQPPTVCT